jgi:hypothetical protein
MKLKLEAFCKLLIYIYILKGLKDNPLYIYAEMSAIMISKLENMIMEVMLDEYLIKNRLFNPYGSYYREFVLSHLTPYEEQTEDNKGFSMFQSGTGGDFIYDPLELEIMKRANLIFKEDRQTFQLLYEGGWVYMNEATIGGGEEDWGDEERFIGYFLDGLATAIITKNRLFQYKFNNILLKLEEDYKKEVLEKIAFNKIKRNELFILGISMKVSMRDCGELIEAY